MQHRSTGVKLSAYYFAYFAFLGVFTPYFALYLHALSSAWDIIRDVADAADAHLRAVLLELGGRSQRTTPAHRARHRRGGAGALRGFPVLRGFSFLLAMSVFSLFWAASLPLVEALIPIIAENAAHHSRVRLWGSGRPIVAVMVGGALLDHLPLVAVLWASAALLLGNVVCSLYVPSTRRRTRPARRRSNFRNCCAVPYRKLNEDSFTRTERFFRTNNKSLSSKICLDLLK